MTDQSVNQSRTTEDDSERVAYQVKVQEKVQTTWLFDTGAAAHVMPKYVWEQLGEPTLQTTRVTLRGTKRMGELLVKRFIGQTKVQFTAVVARDARRCFMSGTQLRAKGYTLTLNQLESCITQPQGGARVTMSRE